MKKSVIDYAKEKGFNIYVLPEQVFTSGLKINCFGFVKKNTVVNGELEDIIFISSTLESSNTKYLIALLLAHVEMEGLNNPEYYYAYHSFEQFKDESEQIVSRAIEIMNIEKKSKILKFRR